jgi:hypothetical protein
MVGWFPSAANADSRRTTIELAFPFPSPRYFTTDDHSIEMPRKVSGMGVAGWEVSTTTVAIGGLASEPGEPPEPADPPEPPTVLTLEPLLPQAAKSGRTATATNDVVPGEKLRAISARSRVPDVDETPQE